MSLVVKLAAAWGRHKVPGQPLIIETVHLRNTAVSYFSWILKAWNCPDKVRPPATVSASWVNLGKLNYWRQEQHGVRGLCRSLSGEGMTPAHTQKESAPPFTVASLSSATLTAFFGCKKTFAENSQERFKTEQRNQFLLRYIKNCGAIKRAPPLLTHRLVNPPASYASRKQRWWRPGWWSRPKPPGEATGGPSGCGPWAQTSPRGCRSCWWRCSGTLLDLNQCQGWRCGAQCSCLCCWWRSVRLSCRFPVEEEERAVRRWVFESLTACLHGQSCFDILLKVMRFYNITQYLMLYNRNMLWINKNTVL